MKDTRENMNPPVDPAEQRILKAAREVFSEKGYDGASIADIAKKANVNKALPYYYFESKNHILNELIQREMEAIKEWRNSYKKEHIRFTKKDFEDFYDQMLSFMMEKRDVLNIAIIETLKDSTDYAPLFEFLDPVMKSLKPSLEAMGPRVSDQVKMLTAAFFFDVIPIFMFVTLGEKWAKFNNLDKREVEEKFILSFRNIYINYMYGLYFGNEEESKKVNRVPDFLD